MYVEALRQLDVNVVAVSDRDKTIAERVKDETRCRRCYQDYGQLLDGESVDFAFAFGRHSEMPSIAQALIDRNIAFAMEKPVAMDARRLGDLALAAEKKRVFAAVALVQRMSPMARLVVQWRGAGELGDFTHLCMRYIAGPPSRYRDAHSEWMLDKEQSGGGCTINLAVHYIDLFTYLTGKRPKYVSAQMNNLTYGEGIEDSSTIVLASEDRAIATIETGYARPDAVPEEYHAFCTTRSYITVRCDTMERDDRVGSSSRHDVRKGNSYLSFVRETLSQYEKGESPIASLRDMQSVMRIVELAYRSSTEKRTMEVQ